MKTRFNRSRNSLQKVVLTKTNSRTGTTFQQGHWVRAEPQTPVQWRPASTEKRKDKNGNVVTRRVGKQTAELPERLSAEDKKALGNALPGQKTRTVREIPPLELPVVIAATPYRGTGKATGGDYFDTPRYKGFEHKVLNSAIAVSVEEIERVRGVWAGGKEPSAQIKVRGDLDDIRCLMDEIGQTYNQDAVLSFTPQSQGNARRYNSFPPPRTDPGTVAEKIRQINASAAPGRRIEGATVRPDGSLELIDIGDQATESIVQLIEELHVKIGYQEGNAEMRYRGKDY